MAEDVISLDKASMRKKKEQLPKNRVTSKSCLVSSPMGAGFCHMGNSLKLWTQFTPVDWAS
jgi:hypothetical protein